MARATMAALGEAFQGLPLKSLFCRKRCVTMEHSTEWIATNESKVKGATVAPFIKGSRVTI